MRRGACWATLGVVIVWISAVLQSTVPNGGEAECKPAGVLPPIHLSIDQSTEDHIFDRMAVHSKSSRHANFLRLKVISRGQSWNNPEFSHLRIVWGVGQLLYIDKSIVKVLDQGGGSPDILPFQADPPVVKLDIKRSPPLHVEWSTKYPWSFVVSQSLFGHPRRFFRGVSGDFCCFDGSASYPPQRSGKECNSNPGQASQRPFVLASSNEAAGNVQLRPGDRYDDEAGVFMKGLVGLIGFAVMYAISRRL